MYSDKKSDKEVLKFFGGLVSLQFIVKLGKQLIKEDRPIKSLTYGMPSTRAAFMCFIVSYLILTNKLRRETITILIGALIISLYAKFHMKEHSLRQIIIGSCIGVGYAYLISTL